MNAVGHCNAQPLCVSTFSPSFALLRVACLHYVMRKPMDEDSDVFGGFICGVTFCGSDVPSASALSQTQGISRKMTSGGRKALTKTGLLDT
jgi:hypothetical protein